VDVVGESVALGKGWESVHVAFAKGWESVHVVIARRLESESDFADGGAI
jgi:hypothetical protein